MDATVAKGLYGVPKLYKLRNIKKVLYWDDINKIINEVDNEI